MHCKSIQSLNFDLLDRITIFLSHHTRPSKDLRVITGATGRDLGGGGRSTAPTTDAGEPFLIQKFIKSKGPHAFIIRQVYFPGSPCLQPQYFDATRCRQHARELQLGRQSLRIVNNPRDLRNRRVYHHSMDGIRQKRAPSSPYDSFCGSLIMERVQKWKLLHVSLPVAFCSRLGFLVLDRASVKTQ